MEISDSDRAQLEKFQIQAEKVWKSKLIQSGFGPSMTIGFNGDGILIESTEVDEDHLKSFLVDFRPLISDGETVFLPKIFSLIEKLNPKKEILNMEREIRSNRKSDLRAGFIKIKHFDQTFNEEQMFDLILNSGYMHLDDEKKEKFEKLDEHGKKLGRHQFLSYIYVEVVAILNLHNCVGLLLTEGESLGKSDSAD